MTRLYALRLPVSLLTASLLAACASTAPPVPQTAARAQDGTRSTEFPGFRRVEHDGKEYFCQTRVVTGSRARQAEICRDREQMKRMAAESEEYRRAAGTAGSQSSLQLDSPR